MLKVVGFESQNGHTPLNTADKTHIEYGEVNILFSNELPRELPCFSIQ